MRYEGEVSLSFSGMEARCGEEMSRDMGEGRISGSGFFM